MEVFPPDQTPRALVTKLMSQGFFDKIRKQCLEEIDTKCDYQNLTAGVDNFVNGFIERQPWPPKLAKIELRERLRRELSAATFFQKSLHRIVDSVLTSKSTAKSLVPSSIELVVCESLGVDENDWIEFKKQRQVVRPPATNPSELSLLPPGVHPTQFPFPPINLFTAPPPPVTLMVPPPLPPAAFIGDSMHVLPPVAVTPQSIECPIPGDQPSSSTDIVSAASFKVANANREQQVEEESVSTCDDSMELESTDSRQSLDDESAKASGFQQQQQQPMPGIDGVDESSKYARNVRSRSPYEAYLPDDEGIIGYSSPFIFEPPPTSAPEEHQQQKKYSAFSNKVVWQGLQMELDEISDTEDVARRRRSMNPEQGVPHGANGDIFSDTSPLRKRLVNTHTAKHLASPPLISARRRYQSPPNRTSPLHSSSTTASESTSYRRNRTPTSTGKSASSRREQRKVSSPNTASLSQNRQNRWETNKCRNYSQVDSFANRSRRDSSRSGGFYKDVQSYKQNRNNSGGGRGGGAKNQQQNRYRPQHQQRDKTAQRHWQQQQAYHSRNSENSFRNRPNRGPTDDRRGLQKQCQWFNDRRGCVDDGDQCYGGRGGGLQTHEVSSGSLSDRLHSSSQSSSAAPSRSESPIHGRRSHHHLPLQSSQSQQRRQSIRGNPDVSPNPFHASPTVGSGGGGSLDRKNHFRKEQSQQKPRRQRQASPHATESSSLVEMAAPEKMGSYGAPIAGALSPHRSSGKSYREHSDAFS